MDMREVCVRHAWGELWGEVRHARHQYQYSPPLRQAPPLKFYSMHHQAIREDHVEFLF